MITLTARPSTPADTDDAPFDPTTFHADVIPDVDATAGPHKCNCAASDDNPY
jgi:hypothetical protein